MATYRGQGTVNAATTTSNSQLREVFTATAAQTVFNTAFTYTVGLNQLDVYVQGLKKLLTTDYVETDSNTITFVSGLNVDDVVEIEATIGGEIVDTDTASNITFTHDSVGAVQTTVEASLKAQNLDLVAELKTLDGAQNQRADVRGLLSVSDGLGGRYFWDSTSTATDTSATTGNVVQQTGVATGRWTKVSSNSFSGDVAFAGVHTNTDVTDATSLSTGSVQTLGGLAVSKNIYSGQDVVLMEQADHSSSPTAGFGYLWVKSDVPSSLQFTDDTGADINISAAGGTVTIANEAIDTTCFPMFGTAATGSLSAKSNANLTYNSATNNLASTTFTGALVGNADTSTTATSVSGAQTGITSVGTLAALSVDNLKLDGNTLSTTAGTDLLITPLTGQQIVLDSTIVVDAGVVTGATSVSSTNFFGALTGNVTGNVTGSSGSCTGNSATATSATTAGTVTTAAQPTITSVGTLTSFTSTGIADNATSTALTIDSSENATFAGTVSITNGTLAARKDGIGEVIQSWTSDLGANTRGINLLAPATDSASEPFIFSTGNSYTFRVDSTDAFNIGSDGAITTSGGVDTNVKLNTKVINIGTWNMVTTLNVSIASGVDTNKIRTMQAVIRNDTDLVSYDFASYDNGSAGSITAGHSTNVIVLTRTAGGAFDGTPFDTMGDDGNRGWITIQYID